MRLSSLAHIADRLECTKSGVAFVNAAEEAAKNSAPLDTRLQQAMICHLRR